MLERNGVARRVLGVTAALVLSCACVAAGAAEAGGYPERPIRLIVPQAPGSSSDTLARVVAIELTKQIGQQVVVDNRPGGALIIGMELTARAAPDGYTIGYAPIGALVISPNLVRKVPFDAQGLPADRADRARQHAHGRFSRERAGKRARRAGVCEAQPGQAVERIVG
jgi:hypothetical protein